MKQFFQKISFMHKHLWRNDRLYSIAFLLGPASLLGIITAFIVWEGISVWTRPTVAAIPPWAKTSGPANWQVGEANGAQKVRPSFPLPASGPDGKLHGYELGWQFRIHTVRILPAFDIDVSRQPLKGYLSDELTGEMSRIFAEGPQNSLYVGEGNGFLVVKSVGTYAITARLERSEGQGSDCLVRVGFGEKRVLSDVEVNLVDRISKTYDAAYLELQPGLYSIAWAFGCWSGQSETANGQIAILMKRPGEEVLSPVRPGEIVRPAQIGG
jgi:hypothetical protein